jgi:copper(I)-binding protein
MAGDIFRTASVGLALAACLLVTACGSDSGRVAPQVVVEDVWVRAVVVAEAPESSVNSAAYLTVRNLGRAPDRLVGARFDIARAVEIHRTTIDSTGLASMARVEAIDLQPGAEIRLETGSYHLMLMGITRSLAVGDTVRLELEFETTGPVEIAAEVRAF